MSANVVILRAPGTNCDLETAHAFELAGAKTQRVHIQALLAEPQMLQRFQILCVPGGFSYGDDLAAGRILGNQIRHRLADHFQEFKDRGKLILGICNGFQVLIKSGILLADDAAKGPAATLTWNDSGRFEARWVRLSANGSKCVFFRDVESMELPVAHAEGKFVTRDAAIARQLEASNQVVLRYRSRDGNGSSQAAIPYPDNPGGSPGAVAGICDDTGRVCGLMPHPERHVDRTQHPQWTRRSSTAAADGLKVFQNAVSYFS